MVGQFLISSGLLEECLWEAISFKNFKRIIGIQNKIRLHEKESPRRTLYTAYPDNFFIHPFRNFAKTRQNSNFTDLNCLQSYHSGHINIPVSEDLQMYNNTGKVRDMSQ